MPKKLSGGCACGAIRYEWDADPLIMMNFIPVGTAKRRAAAPMPLSLWCRKPLFRFVGAALPQVVGQSGQGD
jgi:hypothetical protein